MIRVPIFARLPAIQRIRDAEQTPPDQLRAFTGLIERVLGEVHADIEALYHDLFVDTCADWVLPYLADLVGTSHLTGDPWTLRAELADTVALRRRKGTRGALERLAFDLTGWAVHAIELRDCLAWAQHVNHLRPDEGGAPPVPADRFVVPRGGTLPIRDPATLSLIDTPFDRFAHVPDLRPPTGGAVRYNLPNLALFLWRLAAYTVPAARPRAWSAPVAVAADPPAAPWVARFDVHPLGDPVVLFSRHSFDPDARPLRVGELDGMPNPIARARLARHVTLDIHPAGARNTSPTALCLHVPDSVAPPASAWTVRGANLCAWELGLVRPLGVYEAAIDPVIGRIAIGAPSEDAAAALLAGLRVTYTYGAIGPIGAHPISRPPAPDARRVPTTEYPTIADALDGVAESGDPIVVEIIDSDTHDLDLLDVAGVIDEGGSTIVLGRSVELRAASGHRPIVRLVWPLAFRPAVIDPSVDTLRVRLDGIYLARHPDFPAAAPLIRRAAIGSIELSESTLDPGGALDRHDETRAPIRTAMALAEPYGFSPDDEAAFDQVPELHIRRSITGPLFVDRGYRIAITDSIIDGGTGPYEPPATFAISAATDGSWGPPVTLEGVTLLGRTRVERIAATGAIFAQPLEVLDNQRGCLRWCWLAAEGNRTPHRFACQSGADARLVFTSEAFGRPGYGQLASSTDRRVRERGPADDEIGATNVLLLAHRMRNLHIRYRELLPAGVRPVLVAVT
jgi:hypothetical protein